MNPGSVGADRRTGSNLLVGQVRGNGNVSIYQQPIMDLSPPNNTARSLQLGDLSSNLRRMSMEVSNNIFGSVPQESSNLSVKYRISWSKTSNAYTITLLVPKNDLSSDTLDVGISKPPFQLIDDGTSSNTGNQTHALRMPISYLVNLSNQASTVQKQQMAPWLDRAILRGRLSDGGKALGLKPAFIAQTIAAVEESATRISSWSPPNTESVSVDIELMDGAVSFLAHVPVGKDHLFSHAQSSLQSSHHDFTYNLLSDTASSSLHTPTVPFTGDSPFLSSFSGQTNNFSKLDSQGFGNSFSTSPVNSSDIFGQPKGSLSSFDPWNSKSNGFGNEEDFLPQNLYSQNLSDNVDNFIQRGNSFGSSHSPHGQTPTNVPVSANQLFSSPMSDLRRFSSSESVSGLKQRPDPSIIVEPLLSMGFSHVECEAAVTAIRNLSFAGLSSGGKMKISGESRHVRTHSSESSIASQHQLFHPKQTQSPSRHQRQVSAESILGYVLNNGTNTSMFEHNASGSVATDNMSVNSGNIPTRDSQSAASMSSHSDQMSTLEEANGSTSWVANDGPLAQQRSPVWGNAGKLKVVKSSSSLDKRLNPEQPVESSRNEVGASRTVNMVDDLKQEYDSSPQKTVRVLDIPPDMNAFVFHCNAQTREECLHRELFGCPSGGQYGPHSKAKKGDLLFLADFSAWTVTGIFTAKTDAGLNIDKTAWNGRFPWQIKVNPWNDLRTVHIDKVNEIIGLASGSKLNMLTKDQLAQLVASKEFASCVPSHLFKVKSIPEPSLAAGATKNINNRPNVSEQSISRGSTVEGTSIAGTHGIKYTRKSSTHSTTDEHPATAMHRLKLITTWFDSLASQVLLMNELYNDKKPSSRKESKEKTILDQDILGAIASCKGQSWPLMSYSYIRQAVADIFDQWLMYCHSTASKVGILGDDHALYDTNDWTKQQSKLTAVPGKMREDVVLITNVPGSKKFICNLFLASNGSSGMSVPNSLAEVLAAKFLSEVEQISVEVRKTQLSLMKIGGEHYMKSIEDNVLGMKVTESEIMSQQGSLELPGRKMMKIEWHTKSSIAQGRPPQVQKIYKSHFDVLERSYRNQAITEDPKMSHFLTRLFVLLCRHDLIGDIKHRCQAILPRQVQKVITAHFGIAHECFASPLSNFKSYFNATLFADASSFFGSLGYFFNLLPIEGSFLVNPPFMEKGLKPTFDHIFQALENSADSNAPLSFLVVIRGPCSILNNVEKSHFCRRIVHFENCPKYAVNTLHKDTVSASRKLPKGNDDVCNMIDCSGAWTSSFNNIFIWLQNDIGYELWKPSDEKVSLISHIYSSQS